MVKHKELQKFKGADPGIGAFKFIDFAGNISITHLKNKDHIGLVNIAVMR